VVASGEVDNSKAGKKLYQLAQIAVKKKNLTLQKLPRKRIIRSIPWEELPHNNKASADKAVFLIHHLHHP